MNREFTCAEENLTFSNGVAIVCILAFTLFVSFWGLSSGPNLGDHEAIVAQGARQIRQDGNWLVPHLNNVPFIRKPPLGFWLVAAGSFVFDPPNANLPVSAFSARAPSAVAFVLTTLLVYLLGRSMYGVRGGLVSAAILATSAGGFFLSHNAQVEMVLTLFCTAAFAFFWWGTEEKEPRGLFIYLFYVSFGLAMLAKAPLPLAVIALPLAVWWFVTLPLHRKRVHGSSLTFRQALIEQVGGLRKLRLPTGIFLWLLIVLPWPLYVYMNIDNTLELWKIEFIDRYTGNLAADQEPFWYYLPIALALLFPFSGSLIEAVTAPFTVRFRSIRKELLFVFTWAAVQLVFLSTSAFKRPHYLAATIPALALLLGPVLDSLFLGARSFSRRWVWGTTATVCMFLPIVLIIGGLQVIKNLPQLLWTYTWAGGLLTIGVFASAIFFVRRHRAASLVLLGATAALIFSVTWDNLGRSHALGRNVTELVEQLRAHRVTIDDRITWVMGRPDARIMFYGERRIEPLFSPLELAGLRASRRNIPDALIETGAQKLIRRLASGHKEYFIIDRHSWNQFKKRFDLSVVELCAVEGDDARNDHDDWILVANVLPTETNLSHASSVNDLREGKPSMSLTGLDEQTATRE